MSNQAFQFRLPNILVFQPTASQVQALISKALREGYNYDLVGKSIKGPTKEDLPKGWRVNHKRLRVGYGKDVHEKVKHALTTWDNFQLGWAYVDKSVPVKPGAGLAVCAWTILWTVNPLQIVYTKTEDVPRPVSQRGKKRPPLKRFSFAHGCLQGHLLAGEERFAVDYDEEDDSVWYDIYSFSKPAHPLSFITYPLVMACQSKFAEDSARVVAQIAARYTAEQCSDASSAAYKDN